MEIKEDVFLSLIIAGKITDKEQREHLKEVNLIPPCCGRCWWHWLPYYKKTAIGWDAAWLFVLLSYDNYGTMKNIASKKAKEQLEEIKDII